MGLIALFLSVLGLWLWWPLKKTFKTKDVIPRGVKRKHFYYSHMTSGVVVLFVIVLLSLTGASITYRSVAQQLFGVERNKAASTEAITLDNNWLAWINAAYAHMPEGARLDRIQFPRQPKQNAKRAPYNEETAAINRREKNQQQANKQDSPEIIELRFHAPGDWLGLGGNAVKIDKKSSQLVDVIRFADLPLGEKIYSLLKPLHTGHHLPVAYVFVLLILSLIGTAMVLSGLLSFLLKKRKPSNVTQLLSKILRASKLRAVNSIQ